VAGTITYIFGQLVPLSTKSSRREPAVRHADALAKALPQLLGTLPTGGALADAVAIAFV